MPSRPVLDLNAAANGDHRLAAELATRAGDLLVRLRAGQGFGDPAALRDAGDAQAHDLLVAALASARPDDAVLSEEGRDDSARLSAARVWIVDPLDGTREFGEEGRTDWAVHVALWVGGALAAGAVALPALDVTYSTLDPPRLPGAAEGPTRLVVSRTRAPDVVTTIADRLPGILVPMGSAGAKTMAIVRGDADVYLHAGGQYEWDSAAPVAVAAAAGLHTSRVDGSRLTYNKADPDLPDLLVCRPNLAEALLALVAAVGAGS